MSRLDAALRRASAGAVLPASVPSADHLPPADGGARSPDQRFEDAFAPEEAMPAPEEAMERTGESVPDELLESAPPRIHAFGAKYAEKLVVSSAVPQAIRENYRRLAATLHHAQAETGLKTLMVTSAMPEEGKTLTATNIALTLSESYQRRVLLIDADLRRPALADVFQLPNVFGLNEVLTSVQERRVSLTQVSRHLSVLTSGAPDQDPMRALTSERMQRLLKEAAAGFDWVIIDTPPIGILTDAKLLSAMVDGALLVIRAGKTPARLVQKAVEAIGRTRIVGVVLNRANLGPDGRTGSYYSSQYNETASRERGM
jgi:capsular exopolysaccharide synthesis family protein